MPKADSTFNALGGVMEVYKQTIEEYEAKLAKAEADKQSLLKLIAELHRDRMTKPKDKNPEKTDADSDSADSPCNPEDVPFED